MRRWWRDLVDPREWVETRQALRAARPATLASAPEGVFVRLVGTCEAVDAERLTSPFGERACLAYWLVTEGRAAPFIERRAIAFAFVDGAVRATIDPRGAHVSLSRHAIVRTRTFAAPTAKQREILDQIAGPDATPNALAFTESILAPGAEVVIGGFLVREPESEAAQATGPYREVPHRLRLIGTREFPLLIGDDRRLV